MACAAIWLANSLATATFAKPKSRILACPRLVTKMFAGLMSRCTMPSACAASSASAISMAERQQRFSFQRTPRDAVLQRRAVQKLHDDERLPILLPDLMDGADIGVIQCGSSLSFSLEASQHLGVFGYFFEQKLQRDKSVEGYVLSLVDNAHAATAQLLSDAVVRDGLADHGWRRNSGAMLGGL